MVSVQSNRRLIEGYRGVNRRPVLMLIPLQKPDNDRVLGKFNYVSVCRLAATVICIENEEERRETTAHLIKISCQIHLLTFQLYSG